MILYAKLASIIATDDHLAAGDLDRLSGERAAKNFSLASILAITPQTNMTASRAEFTCAPQSFQ